MTELTRIKGTYFGYGIFYTSYAVLVISDFDRIISSPLRLVSFIGALVAVAFHMRFVTKKYQGYVLENRAPSSAAPVESNPR